MIAIVGLLLVSGALWVLSKYIKHKNHRKYGIPGPEPIFPFGNILTVLSQIRYASRSIKFELHDDILFD